MLPQEHSETIKELFVGIVTVPLADDQLRRREGLGFDDWFVGSVAPDPLLRVVEDAGSLQLRASAVIDVIADVFFIGQ